MVLDSVGMVAYEIRPTDIRPDGRLTIPAHWRPWTRPGQIITTTEPGETDRTDWLVEAGGTATRRR